MLSKREIADVVARHYRECAEGLVDKTSSQLTRGEGTEIDFYVLKIDLANSTKLLQRSRRETYLKLAHTFLSSVHWITQQYGADDTQTEYAGDSVQAYFRCSSTTPAEVMRAAACCRRVTSEIKNLPGVLGEFDLRTRVVLHRGRLVMANIGPWGNVRRTAIGHPLHIVGHMEANVPRNAGLATKDFANSIDWRERSKYLEAQYDERRVEVTPPPPTLLTGGLLGLGGYCPPANTGIINSVLNPPRDPRVDIGTILAGLSQSAPPPEVRIEKELKYWHVRWPVIEREMGLLGL